MDEKNFVDVSSFMLFEATGDSEADSHELNMTSTIEPDYGDDDGDDDAESCICDAWEGKPIFELRDPRGPRDHTDGGDDEKRVIHQDWASDDGDGDDDDDRGNSHGDQGPGHVDDGDGDEEDEVAMKSTAKTRQRKKARVCVDSTMGLLNEMEKSRLFWEACLAS